MSITQSFLYYYFKKLIFTIPLASFVVEQGRIAHLKPIPIVFGMGKPLQKGWQVSQLEYGGGTLNTPEKASCNTLRLLARGPDGCAMRLIIQDNLIPILVAIIALVLIFYLINLKKIGLMMALPSNKLLTRY